MSGTIPIEVTTQYEIMNQTEVANIPVGFGFFASSTQYKWLTVISYITLVLSIVFLVVVIVYMFIHLFNRENESTKYQDISPEFIDGAKVIPYDGSAYQTQELCNSHSDRTIWVNNECQCKAGLYGSTCEYQTYPSEVFCVANSSFDFDYNYSTVNGERLYFTVEGSYDSESCLAKCDKDKCCVGVIHEGTSCKHIYGEITTKPNRYPVYNVKDNCTMFVYNNNQIKSLDRVYAYKGERHLRYYSSKEFPDLKPLQQNIVEELNFVPTKITNQGKLVGVWCKNNFNPDQFDEKLNDPDCYTDNILHPNDEYLINLPFASGPIYGMYI